MNVHRRVLVIGAGGAGLTAALQAAEKGAWVTILEREPWYGGNTSNATGLIRGSETFIQRKLGLKDSWVDDFKELWKSTGGNGDPLLLSRLTKNSGSAHSWLHEHGVTFGEQMITPPRLAQIVPNANGLTDSLYEALKEHDVAIKYGAKVQRLLVSEGSVVGCEAEVDKGKESFTGFDAVVLATGGAWGPRELIEPMMPDYSHLISTWGTPTGGKGDGWRLASGVGGELIDLAKVLMSPAAFLDENLEFVGISTSALRRAGGAIILNQDLKRFVDEDEEEFQLGRRVADLLRSTNQKWVWEVWDNNAVRKIRKVKSHLDELAEMGLLQGDTIEELASRMKVERGRLKTTIDGYNDNFAKNRERDAMFGRLLTHIYPLVNPPFFAMRLGLSISHSKGGIRIDSQARVLDEEGKAIRSLYAAGDDAGGFFGEGYAQGINLLRAVVYGRIAGENATYGTLGAAERQAEEGA